LVREILLDRANGLTGKTIIHPSHAAAVHALSVVSHEEYCDAAAIVGGATAGGVITSTYRNKMNEIRPHLAWAHSTMVRADVFGVAAQGTTFDDLVNACSSRELVA
jgi:citrate lyase beta subunit